MDVAGITDGYARFLAEAGETIAIRRYTGTGSDRSFTDTECLARVTKYEREPSEVAGTITQDEQKVILLAADVTAILPITRDDSAVIRQKFYSIERIDDSTRRVGGELIAIELLVKG